MPLPERQDYTPPRSIYLCVCVLAELLNGCALPANNKPVVLAKHLDFKRKVFVRQGVAQLAQVRRARVGHGARALDRHSAARVAGAPREVDLDTFKPRPDLWRGLCLLSSANNRAAVVKSLHAEVIRINERIGQSLASRKRASYQLMLLHTTAKTQCIPH